MALKYIMQTKKKQQKRKQKEKKSHSKHSNKAITACKYMFNLNYYVEPLCRCFISFVYRKIFGVFYKLIKRHMHGSKEPNNNTNNQHTMQSSSN